MSLDLGLLGSKLTRYRSQFQSSLDDVSAATGIPSEALASYESGSREPTGDHILILADFYKCDYRFFLSNEKLAPFEQTETLFRMHGDVLSPADRWAIQEFLFLCECEETLLRMLPSTVPRTPFAFTKHGTFYKGHGKDAAAALRRHLNYAANEVGRDVFRDIRRIGLHVFRRQLSNSAISGLFVRHPLAGPCVLVNYSEDVYRQRFTAAHEAGHAILDDDRDVNLSFIRWSSKDLSEVRANTFASHFLIPPEFLKGIPEPETWNISKALDWANRLKVSTAAFSFALRDANLITSDVAALIRQMSVSEEAKRDAELPEDLSPATAARKSDMLKRGLSSFYVRLCFEAYRQGEVTAGRVAEMLLVLPQDIHEVANNYGEVLTHGS